MTTSRLCLAAFIATAPAAIGPARPALPPASTEPSAVEELIAEKDPTCPADDKEDVASPDGRKVAWRAPAGQKWSVVVNGVRQGGTFDEVRSLTFSPDGEHLAFAARRDKRWLMVLDGAESAAANDDIKPPVFSAENGRLAYAARRANKWLIVVDGKEGSPTYADVGVLRFSSDGKHVAVDAKTTKKWIMVVDGDPRGGEFDDIVVHGFSRDGQRVAHVGRRGAKYLAVVDGKEGKPFDIIGGLGFSTDSSRFAYAGVDVHKGFGSEKGIGRVVIDGVEGPEFEGVQVGSLLKSMATGPTHLVVGYFRELLSGTHGVTAPVFSPDAKRVAYAARRGKDAATVIRDGEAGAAYPSILAGPVFSPDGQHIAWVIYEAGATSLVVDGRKVGSSASETDFAVDMMFAPDNQRVAFVGVKGGDWYDKGFTRRARRRVYLDGVAGSEYDALFLGELQFTPDGNHLTYFVAGLSENSRDVAFVVIDNAPGKRYDDVYVRPRIDADGRSVSYTAQAGRKIYRVTQPLGQ